MTSGGMAETRCLRPPFLLSNFFFISVTMVAAPSIDGLDMVLAKAQQTYQLATLNVTDCSSHCARHIFFLGHLKACTNYSYKAIMYVRPVSPQMDGPFGAACRAQAARGRA